MRFSVKLKKMSLSISMELSQDMISIMYRTDRSKISHSIKFFWEKQQKSLLK